ncbi:hypothetical protein [Alkalihalobacterium chitinilyticum]|uniref:Uncharacterized protein n=1 Tax=Alkalihalobacterium chitinilyticum TaxID=2980103 RepID=A0ABT5VDM4_9BACI|nr:hypothetical protein [Alkalihalobacterium chitinilyticum]MDE5413529.1 hypothetical protein [Alkalihalobacterium chitinilyticum]
MDNRSATQNARYYRAYVSSFNTNVIHPKNPWVPVWWSAAFPGMGHLMHGAYIKGFVLFIWEFVVNVNSHINESMVYSFTGQFDLAKEVIDTRWVLLYIPVYIASIWDSYRKTIDINKLYVLANKDKAPITPFNLGPMGLNFLDRRQPWLAMVWSMLMPGMGHLYLKRMPTGFFLLFCWMLCTYFSNILPAFHFSLLGEFALATAILNPQWALFMPSLYGFAIYESYSLAVEYNKLYKMEQSEYLKKEYQTLQLHWMDRKG